MKNIEVGDKIYTRLIYRRSLRRFSRNGKTCYLRFKWLRYCRVRKKEAALPLNRDRTPPTLSKQFNKRETIESIKEKNIFPKCWPPKTRDGGTESIFIRTDSSIRTFSVHEPVYAVWNSYHKGLPLLKPQFIWYTILAKYGSYRNCSAKAGMNCCALRDLILNYASMIYYIFYPKTILHSG